MRREYVLPVGNDNIQKLDLAQFNAVDDETKGPGVYDEEDI